MTFTSSIALASLLVVQVPTQDLADFSKDRQIAAVLATVRIRNAAKNREGSGAIVGRSPSAFYVLTAQHLIDGADKLEVSVFAKRTYPRPGKTYTVTEKLAEGRGLADLALLRVAADDDVPGCMRVCPETKFAKSPLAMLSVGCDIGLAPSLRHEKNVVKKLAKRPGNEEPAPFWEVPEKYPAGRSGGPLIDKHGLLVGVCSGTNRDRTYFTHVSVIHQFLKKNGYRWLIEDKE